MRRHGVWYEGSTRNPHATCGHVHAWRDRLGASTARARSDLRGLGRVLGGGRGSSQLAASGCERARLVRPLPRTARVRRTDEWLPQHGDAIDAAARAADVANVARHRRGCPSSGRRYRSTHQRLPKSTQDGPDAHDNKTSDADARRRGQGRRHFSISALARARKRRYVRTEPVDAAQDHEENTNGKSSDDEPHLETAHDALEEPDDAATRERSKTGARFWCIQRRIGEF